MDHQHTKISGYRNLSQEEIDLMNRIKAFGPELEKLIGELSAHLVNQDRESLASDSEMTRLHQADPFTWLNEGRVSMQQGLMFLTRSIAQPTFF
jgi:hypothetical protein